MARRHQRTINHYWFVEFHKVDLQDSLLSNVSHWYVDNLQSAQTVIQVSRFITSIEHRNCPCLLLSNVDAHKNSTIHTKEGYQMAGWISDGDIGRHFNLIGFL